MPQYTCEIQETVDYVYHFEAANDDEARHVARQISEGELFDPVRDVVRVTERSVDLVTDAGTQLAFWED